MCCCPVTTFAPIDEISLLPAWELYQHLVLSLYQPKKIMEQAKNEIKKAVVKKDRLNVVYNERFSEANYTNVINKSCDQIIHSDLREAFIRLRLHLVVLCEQPEASNINKDSFSSGSSVSKSRRSCLIPHFSSNR